MKIFLFDHIAAYIMTYYYDSFGYKFLNLQLIKKMVQQSLQETTINWGCKSLVTHYCPVGGVAIT